MGDPGSNEFGFRSRAAALLSQKRFSDVEIQVIDGNNRKSYPAHKLFLALSSRYFASLFYENDKPPNFVKIFDFNPQTVYLMLQFLYTEEIRFEDTEQATNLYRLANKFQIEDLVKVCVTYLLGEKTTLDNIFEVYEFALSENIPRLLKICRDIVSTQTMDVLKSPKFTEARLPVLEDLFQLEYLSVLSEIDLIEAAIEWARQESLKGMTESWRICVYPLFKHLRFLTLTAIEFCDLVERHQNIFSAYESSKITIRILQPGTNGELPSGFCKNSSPRYKPMSPEKKSTLPTKISAGANKGASAVSTLETSNFGSRKQDSESKKLLDFNWKEHLPSEKSCYQLASTAPINHLAFNSAIKTNVGSRNFDIKEHNWDLYRNNESKPDSDMSSVLVPHKTKYNSLNQNSLSEVDIKPKSKSPVLFQRSLSANQTPTLKIFPQIPLSQRRTIEFPLIDMEKSFSSAFNQDINSYAIISVNRGAIEIYGIELKLKQKLISNDESITAYLTISGSTISTQKSLTYEEKLQNSVYPMNFQSPVKLTARNQMSILVEIEDLSLNRCFGCSTDKLEFNCGLNTTAEISMKSNQSGKNNGDFVFLISRLIYKPSS